MNLWPFGKRETRAADTITASDPYLTEWFGLRGMGGAGVNPDALLSNSAVAVRCVSLRAEMLASVGITDKATYSNTEQEARALVANCLGPLASRIEAAMLRCLLTEEGRRTLYIEHDLAALLKGDVQARFEAYRIGREIGVFSPNDIRRRENETPIPGGDVYHQPANWTPLGSTPEAA